MSLIYFKGGWVLWISLLFTMFTDAMEKPNVVVIICDDLGYADLGFQGFEASRDVLTPNIDQLAKTGIFFQNAYVASSTCGPSRSSLLTGRSSSRFGVEENGTWPDANSGPPTSEILIPKIISKAGYRSAAFGKWHLGELEGMFPIDRGFDYYYGDIGANKDYFMNKLPMPPCWENGGVPEYGPYLTDAITDECIAFIDRHKEQPFFTYVAYNAPHSPFRTKEPLVKRIVDHQPRFKAAYEEMKQKKSKGFPDYDFGPYKGTDKNQEVIRLVYASMLLAVDDGVGKILDKLEKENLRQNTLIFFLSDNGAALARPNDLGGVNLPLRSGKGSVYDGGVRVPFIMNWPGVLKPAINQHSLVSSMDIFSTTVALAGKEVPKDRVIDGVNLIPHLVEESKDSPRETLYFRRKGRGFAAIRHKDYKMVMCSLPKNKSKNTEPNGAGLYQIQTEIEELKDRSTQFPEIGSQLKAMYEQWAKQLPEPLPQYGKADEKN